MYALVQHEVVWASETELTWTAADRAMTAAQEADTPAALAGAAWTLGMVQRSAGDTDGAMTLALEGARLLEPRLEDAEDEPRAVRGAAAAHGDDGGASRPGGRRLGALGCGQDHRRGAE